MNSKLGRSVISALCAGIVFCFAAISTPAQDYHQTYPQPYSQPYPQSHSQHYSRPSLSSRAASNLDHMDNALKGSADAAKIFRDIADTRNKIPQDVLRNAAAVGVFKGVFNLAFIGGHRQGDGAITIRTPGGWSAPVFYKLRGGRLGQDVGASPTDYLLIFMSRESIKDIANGELDLNLDANAVAGPVLGAEGTAGQATFPISKTVFVYSHGKESFAGAVIDDAKLMARDGVNRDFYGMNAFALLSDPSPLPNMCTACLTPGVPDFPQTVAAAVPNQQPAQVVVPQPQIAPPQEVIWNGGSPCKRNRGVKVIVIKIINEGDDDDEDDEEDEEVVEVIAQPQLQPQPLPVVNCCPRSHKRKL
jgi:lipid-binding SYLF domain-containing protein